MTDPPARPFALCLSPAYPDRNGIGLERRIWKQLAALSTAYDVLLVVVRPLKQTHAFVEHGDGALLYKEILVIDVERRSVPTFWTRTGFRLVYELTAGRQERILPRHVLKRVTDFVGDRQPDLVFCLRIETVPLWWQIKPGLRCRIPHEVVDFDDIESLALARSIVVTRGHAGLEASLIRRLRVVRIRKQEETILSRFDMALVCSEPDAAILRGRSKRASVVSIPNSVDVGAPLEPKAGAGTRCILFVGTLSFPPNVDAARYFCLDVLPLIRRSFGDALDVRLVGYRPSPKVQALDGIEGVGVVADAPDLVPYYRKADIVICPIRYGGGTRIKILEAMSLARAVVSTTVGAEGLNATHERDILLADTPEDFAQSCIRLLRDTPLRDRIAAQGHAFVREHFATDVIARTLLTSLERKNP